MRTREWKRIERLASVEAFEKWLETLSPSDAWSRNSLHNCPLHDFIERSTGHSLSISSPDLSEHWYERESQTWPTPRWMAWLMRSVDHASDGKIKLPELQAIFRVGVARNWSNPLMCPEDLAEAKQKIAKL